MATGSDNTRNNSVISSRRQSRNSQYANMELEDLKYELDEKEREINVSTTLLAKKLYLETAMLARTDGAMKTVR